MRNEVCRPARGAAGGLAGLKVVAETILAMATNPAVKIWTFMIVEI